MITERQDRRVVTAGSELYEQFIQQHYTVIETRGTEVVLLGPIRLNSKADFRAYQKVASVVKPWPQKVDHGHD